MDIKTLTLNVGGQEVILETGKYAQRASGAVTARMGDTMVIATVVFGRLNEGLGYFPLQVEYQEKLFAGGKIKGSRWVKRDGRPSDEAVLKARLIDRTIRPLFPKGLANEVQVIIKVLSADGENDADIPGMYAASLALALSETPWDGPVSAVRIGLDKDSREFIVNPTFSQRENSILDLVLSGTDQATLMVEAGANEVDEANMLQAFALAEKHNQEIASQLKKFAKDHGKQKASFVPAEIKPEVIRLVKAAIGDQLDNLVRDIATLKPTNMDEIIAALAADNEEYSKKEFQNALEELIKKAARDKTLKQGIRPDGRDSTTIRQLTSEVSVLPRTHGSAMFKRGATQALTITTLGSPSLNQLIENMEGEFTKRYIHHYSMPPFTVGETGRVGWPSRREVGHGALAERALEPMIPSEEEFPYTIHVVSELMSSNGSTSMASVCGSTLSLMDAGVPIKKPVAGIAMGLIKEGDQVVVLTDIMGFEDHTGDMDFKVAGTREGITAMQMDIKVKGISMEILTQALEQAKVGRLEILEHMLQTLDRPRPQLSKYAPKIETISCPIDRIGEIIGSGGKVIKGIIEETGAQIDVNDEGQVFISSSDQEAIDAAKRIINGILTDPEPGQKYQGTVEKLMDFGAFVNILPGKDGLVHVSKMGAGYIKNPADVVSVGDEVTVWVSEIDDLGRINLTMVDPSKKTDDNSDRSDSHRFKSRKPRRQSR